MVAYHLSLYSTNTLIAYLLTTLYSLPCSPSVFIHITIFIPTMTSIPTPTMTSIPTPTLILMPTLTLILILTPTLILIPTPISIPIPRGIPQINT